MTVLVAMTAVGVTAASCSGSPPSGPTPPASITSIAVSGTPPRVGQSVQFQALGTLSDGRTRDVTADAAWRSSRPDVATAVAGGTIAGIAAGSAEISAAIGEVAGNLAITVAPPDQPATQFTRDYIQASFLGSGPLRSVDSIGCPMLSRWVGFPRGTHVRVRASANMPAVAFSALVSAAAGVQHATGGAITASVEAAPEEVPPAGTNEISVAMHADPQSLGCPLRQGCTRFTFNGSTVVSATALLFTTQAPAAYVHDAIGHGVLGLCHVDGHLIGGPALSLMSFGSGITSNLLPTQLTPFDYAATQPVFGSSLALGSSLQDFIRVGLLLSPSTTLRPAPGAAPQREGVIDAPPTRH